MVLGIEQAECKAYQRRDGTKRDVALVPRQADAEHFLALVHAPRHIADIAHGRGIRARGRAREREARHLEALRETRQEMLLLLRRAVLFYELARAERVRHHDDRANVRRARGDLAEDERLRLRGEAETTMLLGDEHAEEAVALGEIPDFLRYLAVVVAHLPVVDHAAEFGRRAIEKRALLGGQFDRGNCPETIPARLTRENLRVEADRSCLERLLLRFRDARQNLSDLLVDGACQPIAPKRRHREPTEHDRGQPAEQTEPAKLGHVKRAVDKARLPDRSSGGCRQSPCDDRSPMHRKDECRDHASQNKYQRYHRARLLVMTTPALRAGCLPIRYLRRYMRRAILVQDVATCR